jgi:hypothetical protein
MNGQRPPGELPELSKRLRGATDVSSFRILTGVLRSLDQSHKQW